MRQILVPLDGTRSPGSGLSRLEEICSAEDELVLLSVEKPGHAAYAGFTPGALVASGSASTDGRTSSAVGPDLPHFVETQDQVIERQLTESKEHLEELAYPLRQRGLHVRIETRVEPEPEKAIIEYARETKPTMIAVLPRMHPGLIESVLGTSGNRLLRAHVAPVLFLPEDE
jgi:nucleotide-binding universal stress UspA family protein